MYDSVNKSNPLNKMSRSVPAKGAKYIVCFNSLGKYCGHCLKKRDFGGTLPAPLEKIGRFALNKGKVWNHQQLVPCSLQNCTLRLNCCYSNKDFSNV